MSGNAADLYRSDPYWKTKPLTPAQLLIHDVGLESLRPGQHPRLEINEVPSSPFMHADPGAVLREKHDSGTNASQRLRGLGSTRSEQHQLQDLQQNYEWMRRLRRPASQDESVACRWIHISSKFPEFLHGAFLGLSDWTVDPEAKLDSLRQIDRCIYDNERFSKHGKYFSPFFKPLSSASPAKDTFVPVLICVPFLDWTVYPGPTPALRFQVDERGPNYMARSGTHPLRSLLQHYYRLEDTSDRERTQVFSKHTPWEGDREIDLKIRRWYGYYPTGLNVDQLWVLVVDRMHIVTFSSNQSWKSRWPPWQLQSRISDVSFRGIRDSFFNTERRPNYTSLTHAICCVHGAVGMLHRSFWTDFPMPLSDRYSGYLSHLQYRLYRAPNTKLVTDLMQILDELNIVLQITKQQEDIIGELGQYVGPAITFVDDAALPRANDPRPFTDSDSPDRIADMSLNPAWNNPREVSGGTSELELRPIAPPRLQYAFRPPNPIDECLTSLRREHDDLKELRNSSSDLVTRTVQLVNIRLEDHGRAILVFTVVTIIFLPLSFISSYFGMNLRGVKESSANQGEFWIIAAVLTACVVVLSLLLAFYGGKVVEILLPRRDISHRLRRPRS